MGFPQVGGKGNVSSLGCVPIQEIVVLLIALCALGTLANVRGKIYIQWGKRQPQSQCG